MPCPTSLGQTFIFEAVQGTVGTASRLNFVIGDAGTIEATAFGNILLDVTRDLSDAITLVGANYHYDQHALLKDLQAGGTIDVEMDGGTGFLTSLVSTTETISFSVGPFNFTFTVTYDKEVRTFVAAEASYVLENIVAGGSASLRNESLDLLRDVPTQTVTADGIYLHSTLGQVGTSDKHIQVDLTGSLLDGHALEDFFADETNGTLDVGVVDSTNADVWLTSVDTPGSGDDLVLGSGALVSAPSGNVNLLAGDDLFTAIGSLIVALQDALLFGDFADADPSVGSTMDVAGNITAAYTLIRSNQDGRRPHHVRIDRPVRHKPSRAHVPRPKVPPRSLCSRDVRGPAKSGPGHTKTRVAGALRVPDGHSCTSIEQFAKGCKQALHSLAVVGERQHVIFQFAEHFVGGEGAPDGRRQLRWIRPSRSDCRPQDRTVLRRTRFLP